MRILFLHALPLDERMWEPQREVFAEHELLTPNLYRLGGQSMEQWATALLREVWGEVVVVGASMGGYCALALARLAPERIRGLVLAGSRADPDTPERKDDRMATIGAVQQRGVDALWEKMEPVLTAGADDAVAARIGSMAREQAVGDVVTALRAVRDRVDSMDVVEGLHAPLLVVVGDADALVPTADAEALAAAAPNGRAVVVEGGGHLPSLVQPDRFNAALAAFLDELG